MSNRNKIVTNLLWRLMERIGAQGISLIVSIILARILEPRVYGSVAIVLSIIALMNVLVDSGFGVALIQKEDADQLDFSTVFWFNILICSLLYLIIFFFSPIIANYYKIQELNGVIKVLSICILISGVKNVQQAYVSRNLLFKKFFFSTLGGTLISGLLGLFLAYNGYGIWALVFQNLSNHFFDTLILWITVKWRPSLQFSYTRFKSLFSFGWKLLIAALIDTFYNQLRQLIIGKKYSSESLAYYNQGFKFPNLLVININTSIDSVILPAMSMEQSDLSRVKTIMRRAIKSCTFIILPMMAGLAACAPAIVRVILTDKWLPCVPFMRLFCISFALYPINTANLNAIKAMGRSDISLKLEVIKKSIGIISIILTMGISTMALAYSFLFTSIMAQVINAYPNKKLLQYGYKDLIIDIFPQCFLSVVMFVVILLFKNISEIPCVVLLIQIIIGLVFYVLGSAIMKIDSYYYFKNIISNFFSKRV